MRSGVIAWLLCGVAVAQTGPLPGQLSPVPFFRLKEDGPVIRRPVEAGKPFTMAGLRGVVVGQQEGGFEAWILPVKLLSNFSIRAEVDGYPVPIDADRPTVIRTASALPVPASMPLPPAGS